MKKIFLLACLLALFASCSGGTASSSFGPDPSTGGSDNTIDGTSDGITTSSNFYVGVEVLTNSLAHVHTSSSFVSACSISSTDPYSDVSCLVDAPEAEFAFNGLELKYNVPVGFCRYLRRRTYWFYNREVGIGPTDITITRVYSGDALQSADCSVDGSAAGVCSGFREVTIDPVEATPEISCVYNRSSQTGGRNCCFGNYTLNINDDIDGIPSNSSEQKKWAGNFAECIGGPGRTDWEFTDGYGVPNDVVDNARFGLNTTYKVKPTLETYSSLWSIPIANYYTPALHTHAGFGAALGLPATRSSNLPYFMDPIDDRNGTVLPTSLAAASSGNFLVPGNQSYDFECLDEAFEVKHKIRVFARDWDTYADYLAYIQSQGVTAVPDRGVTGVEGSNCDGIDGPCNDFYDLDDVLAFVSYDNTLGDITNRNTYFPGLTER